MKDLWHYVLFCIVVIFLMAILGACEPEPDYPGTVVNTEDYGQPNYRRLVYLLHMTCNEEGERCGPLVHPEGHVMPLTYYWKGEECRKNSDNINNAYRPRLAPGYKVWAQCTYIATGPNDIIPLSAWDDWWHRAEGIWFRDWARNHAKEKT